jgi:hypothetical protein
MIKICIAAAVNVMSNGVLVIFLGGEGIPPTYWPIWIMEGRVQETSICLRVALFYILEV